MGVSEEKPPRGSVPGVFWSLDLRDERFERRASEVARAEHGEEPEDPGDSLPYARWLAADPGQVARRQDDLARARRARRS